MQSSGEVCRYHGGEGIPSIWASGAGAGMRKGVSTSRYPPTMKNRLISWMIAALASSALLLRARVQLISMSPLDPGGILAGAGVDGDELPLFDEGGDPQHVAGFHGCRLGIASR